ncbi:hypothetical protein RND81_08G189200 [Saponaria officinalis]|uniref:Calmodulin-binding domain-containing protein n=1 Tax=Saponaria officinalis TaxID=3572 RepID=A0AAW1J9L9_SAPOF
MAAIVRGSSSGKEKTGTSPSSSIIKKSTRLSTSAPRSSSSSPTKDKISASTDGKPVPNYLKPTISSNLDFSRISKKSSTESSLTQRSEANRRRSIDRPPSASQVQKGVRTVVPGPREVKSLRSSSFSHKSSTSSSTISSLRPTPERTYARTVSTLKEGRNDSVVSKPRSLKKSSTMSSTITPKTKKERSGVTLSSSSKKAPKSVTSESSVDQDNSGVDRLVVEDDFISVENDDQSLPEISEMPDSSQELGDPTVVFIDGDIKPTVENVQDDVAASEQLNVQHHQYKQEEHDMQTVENVQESLPVVVQEEHRKQDEQHDNRIVETQKEPENVQELSDDKNLTVEKQNITVQEQNMTVEEQNKTVAEQNLTVESAEPQKVEVMETELVEETTEESVAQQKPDNPKEEQEAMVENQTVSSPAPESASASAPAHVPALAAAAAPAPAPAPAASPSTAPVTAAAPAPARASAPAKGQTASGKKDKQQAYNDIIEQTSTKLMGGRKNKVLALAGAFETVISLQDTHKN